ncbi:hypothetical protein VKT23_002083 [Stygiomarasmius scandens]|uniref:Uncharacterized protein n=1 Tax=Marasmiellus scandens TaxID=2682957 RepID=A0ABR1K2U8_9AGAR
MSSGNAQNTPISPTIPNTTSQSVNVTVALNYLDAVQTTFQDQPDVYGRFVDIMKEFKNRQIDTLGTIKLVSELFMNRGRPGLVRDFNTFLPAGYSVVCCADTDQITITTPYGIMIRPGDI